MTNSWLSWPLGFALTLLLELPVVHVLLTKWESKTSRLWVLFLFANLVTHPLVWFFFPSIPIDGRIRLTIAELWAFCGEAAFYWICCRNVRLTRAIVTSFCANAVSCGIGMMLAPTIFRWALNR